MPTRSKFRKRESRRRGFRIVLWTMGLFFLAQVLGGLFLDYSWIRARNPWQADVYNYLQARATPPEILFLGSSRFCSDWNCSVLDAGLRQNLGEQSPRTFNAAVPCGDTTASERILEDVLRTGYRPKLVVVEVSPVFFARGDFWLNDLALRLLDWRDFPEAFVALCRNGMIMSLVRGRLLPLYLHRYQICNDGIAQLEALFQPRQVQPKTDPPVGAAVQADPDPPPPISPATLARVKESCQGVAAQLKHYQPGNVASDRLERLLERCRSLGIPVLLLQPPVHSLYRQAVDSQVNAIFVAYMNQLAQRYGCRYCDWSAQLPDPYFRDEHHAHYQEGSVYLSRRFAPLVLTPLWREIVNASKGTDEGKPRTGSNSL